jgi:hypothetical protein
MRSSRRRGDRVTVAGVRTAVVALLSFTFLGGTLAQSASAQSGDTGPPATKRQCLQILKKDQHEYAAEHKAFPGLDKKQLAKVDALRVKLKTAQDLYDALGVQIETIRTSNVDALTPDEYAALTVKFNALVQQQRDQQIVVDDAGVKVSNAVSARATKRDKYKDDMKNWPVYIKQIKTYCAKM